MPHSSKALETLCAASCPVSLRTEGEWPQTQEAQRCLEFHSSFSQKKTDFKVFPSCFSQCCLYCSHFHYEFAAVFTIPSAPDISLPVSWGWVSGFINETVSTGWEACCGYVCTMKCVHRVKLTPQQDTAGTSFIAGNQVRWSYDV